MNKSDLIEMVSSETGLKLKKVEEAVNTVFNGMADELANVEREEIRGFGSFKVKQYEGYHVRNARTGQIINVKPKKMPFFKCGKELREKVDSGYPVGWL